MRSMRKLYSPRDEAELAIIRSLLEAEGIDCFVHNDHFGSLRPGPQIPLYNAKTVIVADDDFVRASELIAELHERSKAAPLTAPEYSLFDKIRMFLEAALFAWIMPGTRKRKRGGPGEGSR